MNYNNNFRVILISFAFLILFNNCAEEDESKIHLFYGDWVVNDVRATRVNGISGPLFKMKYLIELNSENCGTKYNLDGEKIDRLKWVYQENDTGRHFLLSTQGSATEGISNLSQDNLYFVGRLTEDEILLTRGIERVSNDTTFTTIWNLILTKE